MVSAKLPNVMDKIRRELHVYTMVVSFFNTNDNIALTASN